MSHETLRTIRIRDRARRLLAGTRRIVGGPIFPGYTSFEEAGRPAWWGEERVEAAWGEVFGVHEVERGSPVGALVVTERGLAVLSPSGGAEWVTYEEIEGHEQLCKEPVSSALVLKVAGGRRVAIPFQPDGEAFTFVQFVSYAQQETLREAGGAPP